MSRLPYLTEADLPPEYAELFEVDEENPDDVLLNIHRAMANNPRILEAWSDWAWTVYDETPDKRIREMVILAVANEVDSRYVWHQHVPPSIEHGVTRKEILALSRFDFDQFAPAENAVLEYVTALVTGTVDEGTHDTLVEFFPEEHVVAIIFLASEYLQIARVTDAMALDLESEFVGWELEGLDR